MSLLCYDNRVRDVIGHVTIRFPGSHFL